MRASLLFKEEIQLDHAHLLHRITDHLSYGQIVMIAAISNPDPRSEAPSELTADMRSELETLSDLRVVGVGQPGGHVARTSELWSSEVGTLDVGSFMTSPIGAE